MKHIFFTCMVALACVSAVAQPKVIAHRGYWDTDNSAQNSLTALYKAHAIGCYGSEFDVHMTSDGQLVVFHDNRFDGMTIKDTPYEKLRDHQLKNGEVLPTLDQYLVHAKNCLGMQLIMELKTGHKEAEWVTRFVKAAYDAVEKHQLQARTEYIAFSLDICKELRKQRPQAKVYYLNGDLSAAELKELNLTGLDYQHAKFAKDQNLVYDAHRNGLLVNVWTVNDSLMMNSLIGMGVDFITTDKPELAQKAIKKYTERYATVDNRQVDLSARKKDKNGYIYLFDGTSLDGWRLYNKNEIDDRWVIEDGCLKFDSKKKGKGSDIIFSHKFRNFELELDWKIAKGGNSGVFYMVQEMPKLGIVASALEAQVLDNDNHPDAKKGKDGNRKSSSLYDLIPAKPQNSKSFGKWNNLKIKVNNGLVQHYQNGKKVVEYSLWTPEWVAMLQDSKFSQQKWPDAFYLLSNCGGTEREGYIGLQDHGDDVWFKNIKIKVLP